MLYAKLLTIEKFRNFKSISIGLGNRITVISGQNGVGKSNLLSLIASGSGVSKKGLFGNNFQPEFYEYFYLSENECIADYQIYISYRNDENDDLIDRRLSFKNDTADNRGIRIIPRTTNHFQKEKKVKEIDDYLRSKYELGGSARVNIPTIYLSLSRLYPLGEDSINVKVDAVSKRNNLFSKEANKKFYEWYNQVIPGVLKNKDELKIIDKSNSKRKSMFIDMGEIHALSQSIGQDNIGNIISSLIDVYLLTLEEKYEGSIICIDEIDVSLHPDTQIRLLNLLNTLSNELKIQFILTTHSLTIIKQILKWQKLDNEKFSFIYLLDPALPRIQKSIDYQIIKADMFNKLQHNLPKQKIYFEDNTGLLLFEELIRTFKFIYSELFNDRFILRNINDINYMNGLKEEFKKLDDILNFENSIEIIPVFLGCEELFNLSEKDEYFNFVIIVLDGDARIKESASLKKPLVKDYLDNRFNSRGLTTREHKNNICFLPDYFAPESFIYRIVYEISNNPSKYSDFWNSLDLKSETTLYTSTKIKEKFILGINVENKNIKNNHWDELWNFVKSTDILMYYYKDYNNISELLDFAKKFINSYEIVRARNISSKF